jgi:hypothetical protein
MESSVRILILKKLNFKTYCRNKEFLTVLFLYCYILKLHQKFSGHGFKRLWDNFYLYLQKRPILLLIFQNPVHTASIFAIFVEISVYYVARNNYHIEIKGHNIIKQFVYNFRRCKRIGMSV